MVGELELTFEIPLGNALVDQVTLLLTAALFVAADRKYVLLHLDRKISAGDAGDCYRDVVGVLARTFDIVRRIARRRSAFRAAGLVEH